MQLIYYKQLPAVVCGAVLGVIYISARVTGAAHPWHALLMAGVMLGGWIYYHRRYRSIVDTPTARIGTAPQGYTEISGIGRQVEGAPVYAPHTGQPCLWYRVTIDCKDSRGRWRRESVEESDASFILDDGTGQCAVDPEHAEVVASKCEVFKNGDHRITQWLLLAGTKIVAIGHFVTHSVAVDRPSASVELREKLAAWKQNGETKRFDLNKDGQLSQQEWELARAAAKREVAKERREADKIPGLNMLVRPSAKRAFIISDLDSDTLANRNKWFAWGCLVLFFVAFVAFVWLMTNGF